MISKELNPEVPTGVLTLVGLPAGGSLAMSGDDLVSQNGQLLFLWVGDPGLDLCSAPRLGITSR